MHTISDDVANRVVPENNPTKGIPVSGDEVLLSGVQPESGSRAYSPGLIASAIQMYLIDLIAKFIKSRLQKGSK